ncbi:MAG TPA: hypothetical protein VIV82_05560 [Verrucomicrobiae bacterium]
MISNNYHYAAGDSEKIALICKERFEKRFVGTGQPSIEIPLIKRCPITAPTG